MKKKILLFLLAGCVLSFTACVNNGSGDKGTTAAETEMSETESSETEETEEDVIQIGQGDADAILAEKLDGTGCQAVYNDFMDIGEEEYYTYTVVDSDDTELDQMLAVNAVSGDVVVYDLEADEISDYSTFKYYNEKKDADVNWEGDFYLDPRTVHLEPADDTSFEFTITKDGEDEPELQGIATTDAKDRWKAIYDDGELSLTFERTENGLEIHDNGDMSGFAAIYEDKSNLSE
ncbi:hypothetical protein SAMN06296386_10531 [Lachnospiraceae bacterium]|nr:hypothetical protein SAMN06296386_10531 [Lachnospiraceae bacterium]